IDAARGVELVKVYLHAIHGELAVDVDRPGQRPECADLDLGVGHAWNVGSVRTERGNGGEGKCRAECGCKSLHWEPPGVQDMCMAHGIGWRVPLSSLGPQCLAGDVGGKSLDQYFANAGWVSALLPALVVAANPARAGRRLARQRCYSADNWQERTKFAHRRSEFVQASYSAACSCCRAGSLLSRSSASSTDITSAYFSDMSKRLTACETWL